MTRQSGKHRYELLHQADADFVVYQQDIGGGHWQTVSAWMIPHA